MSAPVDTAGGLPAAVQEARIRRATSLWSWTAILSIAAAGVLHLVAAADHVQHSTLVVVFFLAVAAGQIAAAGWLFVATRPGLRPAAWILAAGLAATVALIGLYLVAHRTDLFAGLLGQVTPAGGHHGPGHPAETTGAVALDQPVTQVEESGLLGTATLAAELATVVALTALLPRKWRGRAIDSLCALGALTWVLWLTGVLG